VQTKLTHAEYFEKYPNYAALLENLASDQAFDYSVFKDLPGWTFAKCKDLHQKHIDARNQK
jgi:hypothetical protein